MIFMYEKFQIKRNIILLGLLKVFTLEKDILQYVSHLTILREHNTTLLVFLIELNFFFKFFVTCF